MSVHSSLAAVVDDSLHFDMSNFGWLNQNWHFSGDQLGIVLRFRERTSVTIGNPQMAPIYRDLVCQLACKVRAFLYRSLGQLL